jgi:A/G-specific adenine glycosylase
MSFASKLLAWYEQNARDLPWRSLSSPYRTWISEIMLQQTQVDTVIPYFERWMAAFPDVHRLAEADEQTVLGMWEGLGYYRRARYLHRAARQVVAAYEGHLPQDVDALKALPGIGPYTAAAIASIAFGKDVAAVDGNIRRVLSRVFNVHDPVRTSVGEKKIWALAEQHLPSGKAGHYNQALMDLGAMICTPKAPQCEACPLQAVCLAHQIGIEEELPVKPSKKALPHHIVTAAVLQEEGRFLLTQRPADGLLGGMWEFPGGTLEADDGTLENCLVREIQEELGVSIRDLAPFGQYQHAYTHFKITLHAFRCVLACDQIPQPLEADQLVWVEPEELDDFPMGKVDRQIANRLKKEVLHGTL